MTESHACTYCPTCIDGGWLTAVQELLLAGVIESRTALLQVRLQLRARSWTSAAHRVLAADVLAGVCGRLVSLGESRAYFESVGDLPAAVPDTPAGLE